MDPQDPTDEEPQSPTALQDSTAPIVRTIRAAHTAGVDLKLDASAAGQIADYIENLARLADEGREKAIALRRHIAGMQTEVDRLQQGFDWAKALVIQSQRPK